MDETTKQAKGVNYVDTWMKRGGRGAYDGKRTLEFKGNGL